MELFGDNLESYLYSKNGTLPISFVIKIAIKMLKIIKEIHFRYLLHRDIKPRNIVLPFLPTATSIPPSIPPSSSSSSSSNPSIFSSISNRTIEDYSEKDMENIHLIDFGLSKLYVTSNSSLFSLYSGHIPFNDPNIHNNITGTSRFASISVLTGYGKRFIYSSFKFFYFNII